MHFLSFCGLMHGLGYKVAWVVGDGKGNCPVYGGSSMVLRVICIVLGPECRKPVEFEDAPLRAHAFAQTHSHTNTHSHIYIYIQMYMGALAALAS